MKQDTLNKKVSLYIPTSNSGKTIVPCLKSVLEQDYKIGEILIVDNGSSDDTIEKVMILKRKSRIPITIISQHKRGLGNARNIAVRASRYGYLAALDSDCYAEKNWLSILMGKFNGRDIAGAGGMLIERRLESIYDLWRDVHMNQSWGDRPIENPIFLFGSNTVFRKNILKEIGNYDKKFLTNHEDVDISKRLISAGYSLAYEPMAISYHLRQDDLLSLLDTYYRWTFHSYPLPDRLGSLILKIFFYNPYNSLNLMVHDLCHFKFNLVFMDILIYFYNSYRDISYLSNKQIH